MSNFDTNDQNCVNTIRCLAIDMVQKACSGHPGMPLGMAPTAHVLQSRIMKYSGQNSNQPNRDRFILSNGHGCALLYSMLHLCNYKISLNDLKNFRQIGSVTPGHPELHITDGVEVTTGPLGQGFANAVGMAICRKHAAAIYNKPDFDLINHKVYVFCGDGCLQEGISSEAASLAGHLLLNDLIVIYDDNKITIDGKTDLSFSENVEQRFQAYGWKTINVSNGNTDLNSIEAALLEARNNPEGNGPVLISVKTTIGYGSPKENTAGVHGAPLGIDAVAQTKKSLGLNASESFFVSDEVREFYSKIDQKNEKIFKNQQVLLTEYKKKFESLGKQFERQFCKKKKFDIDLYSDKPSLIQQELESYLQKIELGKSKATRTSSGEILNILANHIPNILVGSSDLTPSNKTWIKCSHDFQKNAYDGRYIRYGVREHAMIAIGNGISSYGYIPCTATFLNFITYGWGAVRVGAFSKLQQIMIMTHDSIGLGEDGPTHQPVEVLPLLRSTPNLLCLRPADSREVVGCYIVAIKHNSGPTVLSLSRQNIPELEYTSSKLVDKGAYTIKQFSFEKNCNEFKPDLILIASGSEVSLAIQTAEELVYRNAGTENENLSLNVKVVSCPSQEIFRSQPYSYRIKVLPLNCPIVSIEASSVYGQTEFSHYQIGMTSFGASGPSEKLMEKFGFTAKAISKQCRQILAHRKQVKQQTFSILKCQQNDFINDNLETSEINGEIGA